MLIMRVRPISQFAPRFVETLDRVFGMTRRIQIFTQVPSNLVKFPSGYLSATGERY